MPPRYLPIETRFARSLPRHAPVHPYRRERRSAAYTLQRLTQDEVVVQRVRWQSDNTS